MRSKLSLWLAATIAVLLVPLPALAQDAGIDSGNTAWILTTTALVLFMTMPGLALFYGGLVRAQHVLSVFMHCVAICCLASVLWLAVGYSLAFSDGNALIGGLQKSFLMGVRSDTVNGDIPETVFFMFQMTFAIITPALIVGAYPERINFSAVLIFSAAWLLLVYVPICHWVWGGGWLATMGVMDFAGGLVVHATAGASALVLVAALGPRKGFPNELRPPHSPGMTLTGAAMLWVGWFGFNAGSALAADGSAGMAMTATHISAATASLTWMVIEWIKFGKPSLVGIVTGTIAGLATITPASGFVGPIGALFYGVAAGCVCFLAVRLIKNKFKIDDSLDVFAVHGIGGIMGTLLAAVFALTSLGGSGLVVKSGSSIDQFGVQAIGVLSVVAWSVVESYIIVKITKALVGLRVADEDEHVGLDLTAHGERAYDY